MEYFKNWNVAKTTMAGMAVYFVVCIGMVGCNFREWITIKAPDPPTFKEENKMTLEEADDKISEVTSYLKRLVEKREDGQSRVEAIENILWQGAGAVDTAFNLTGLLSVGGIMGVAGTALGKKKLSKEKEASYNAGIELGNKINETKV